MNQKILLISQLYLVCYLSLWVLILQTMLCEQVPGWNSFDFSVGSVWVQEYAQAEAACWFGNFLARFHV